MNYGTLFGNVALGGATLNLEGDNGNVVGAVTGSSSVVNVNGSFAAPSTFDVGTFNIAQSGTLNMMNGITTAAGFNNHGTLFVDEGVTTAKITGNYVQDGVLSIGASSINSYGKLTVSGNATKQRCQL